MNHQSSARPTEASESNSDRLRTLLDNLNNLKGKLQNFTVIDEAGEPIGAIQDLILDDGHQLNLVIAQSNGELNPSSVLLNGRRIRKVSVQTQSVFVDIAKVEIQSLPAYVAAESALSADIAATGEPEANMSGDLDLGSGSGEPVAIVDSINLDLEGTSLDASEDLMDWNEDTNEGFTDLDSLPGDSFSTTIGTDDLLGTEFSGFELGSEDNLAGLEQSSQESELSEGFSSENLLGDLSELDLDFSNSLSDLGEPEPDEEKTGLELDLSLASDELATGFTPPATPTHEFADSSPELDLEFNQPRPFDPSLGGNWEIEAPSSDLMDLADLDFGSGDSSLDLGIDSSLALDGEDSLDLDIAPSSDLDAAASLDLGIDTSLDFDETTPSEMGIGRSLELDQESVFELGTDIDASVGTDIDIDMDIDGNIDISIGNDEIGSDENALDFSSAGLDFGTGDSALDFGVDDSLDFSDEQPEALPDLSANVDAEFFPEEMPDQIGAGELSSDDFSGLDLDQPSDSLDFGVTADGDFPTTVDLEAQTEAIDDFSINLGIGEDGVPFEDEVPISPELDFDTAEDLSVWQADSMGQGSSTTDELDFDTATDLSAWTTEPATLSEEFLSEDPLLEESLGDDAASIGSLADLDFEQSESGLEETLEDSESASTGWNLGDAAEGLGVAGMGIVGAGAGAIAGMMARDGEPAQSLDLSLDFNDLQLSDPISEQQPEQPSEQWSDQGSDQGLDPLTNQSTGQLSDQLGEQGLPDPETVDEMVPLLEERLQVEYQRRKIGEVIVRKRIETRMVQVPVRYETLVIEQVSPEHKQLAEVDLSQGEAEHIELTGLGGKPMVSGEFKSPKVAAHVLDAIAQALRHRCKSVRIEVELDDSKLQAAYQEWLNQCSRL